MYRMYYNLPIKVSVTYHTLQWLLLLAFTAQRVKLATIHCQWLVKENLAQITSTFTDNYHQHRTPAAGHQVQHLACQEIPL